MFEKCPCGVGASYLACCAPLHLGQRAAETPEQLMRSRYSAFARGDAAYLLRTWAPETRPVDLGDLGRREWTGLDIHEHGLDGPDDGFVRFTARYRQGDRKSALRERSRFRREAGAWVYVDGDAH